MNFMNRVILVSLVLLIAQSFAGTGKNISAESKNIESYFKILGKSDSIIDHSGQYISEGAQSTGGIAGFLFGLVEGDFEEAYVQAFNVDSTDADGSSYGIGKVEPDGHYMIDGLTPGKYYVFAMVVGFEPLYYENARTISDATPVGVEEGLFTEDINFRMQSINPGTGSITGFVYDATTGAPLQGVQVSAFSTGFFPINHAYARTDSNGYYKLKYMKSDSFFVFAWQSDYLQQYYDKADNIVEATPVIVTEPNETSGIDFNLKEGGSISGRVAGSDGHPLPEVFVQAVQMVQDSVGQDSLIFWPDPTGIIEFGSAMTDFDGNYKISGLHSGEYYVMAHIWDPWGSFQMMWYDNVFVPTDATPVNVVEGEEASDINFEFSVEKPTGVVQGTVTDANSTPVVDAWLTLHSDKTSFWGDYYYQSRGTDEEGKYIFKDVPEGSYYLSVWAQNGWQRTFRYWPDAESLPEAEQIVIQNDAPPFIADFSLEIKQENGAIQGIVLDALGQPLANANVNVSPASSPDSIGMYAEIWAYANTDSAGFYSVNRLPEGSYYVQASFWRSDSFGRQWYDHADSQGEAAVVVVNENATTPNIDFDLNVKPMYGSIVGTVVDENTGLPIRRAYVEILWDMYDPTMSYRPFWYQPSYAITDDNGFFAVDYLYEGSYKVAVYANNAFEYFEDATTLVEATSVVVTGGIRAEIEMKLAPVSSGVGSIAGHVADEAGTPFDIALLSAQKVEVDSLVLIGPKYYALADEDGSYTLSGLPEGDYIVHATAPWSIGKYYDDVYDPNEAEIISVATDVPVVGIDFEIPNIMYLDFWMGDEAGRNAGWTVWGVVNDGDGNPLEGATVQIMDEAGNTLMAVTTRSDGSYEAAGLPPGSYIVNASFLGFESVFNGGVNSSSQATPIQSGNGGTEVNFNLNPQTSTHVKKEQTPDSFELLGNYPNPFNPETTISFSIPEAMDITLRIYNIRGELVNELHNGRMASGSHNIKWYGINKNGQQVGSGVYIYTLETPESSSSGKMILMR